MPTVIDSLVLEFNLDASQFSREQQKIIDDIRKMSEQANRQALGIEDAAKRITNVFTNLQRGALGVIGGFFGGEVLKTIDHFERLQASAQMVGATMRMTGNDLIGWQNAMRMIGANAEDANQGLQSLNDRITDFAKFGGAPGTLGAMLGLAGITSVVDPKTGKQKDPGTIFLQMIEGLEARGTAPGADMRDALIKAGVGGPLAMLGMAGSTRVRQLLAEGRSTLSPQDMENARKYVENVGKLDAAFNQLGATIVNFLAPTIITVSNSLDALFRRWLVVAGSPEDKAQQAALDAKLQSHFGDPKDVLDRWTGWSGFQGGPLYHLGTTLYGAGGRFGGRSGSVGGMGSDAEVEAYIRQQAISRGIDPNVAVQVWSSEGRGGYVGDQGTSFGPFQLHYGGNSVGDAFTKSTGKLASDPGTWKDQVQFALDWAKSHHSWRDWHGWKGPSGAGLPAQVSVNINSINVNGKNAAEVASNLSDELRRRMIAANANFSVG
jgi:hypothetical protein